ncbi:MAG: NAD(P)H-hydrate dehydratase [Planctomycetota bacterium]
MSNNIRDVSDLPRLENRPADGHKGSFGRVLIVGGSRGMIGAPALAATAALRSGAGLVTMALPECIQKQSAVLQPCATSVPCPCRGDAWDASAAEMISHPAGKNDVLAIGPGFDVGDAQQAIIADALGRSEPLVIDADGLNNLAKMDDWPAQRRCPLVLTPHPGELSRLTGANVGEIQASRAETCARWAAEWAQPADAPLVLVLKGAGTVVCDGQQRYTNDTGNPGLATGGTGDVLTGIIAALLGQGLSPFDAACLGVWAHGLAGDLAAETLGEISLIASDLPEYLPQAFAQLVEQRG